MEREREVRDLVELGLVNNRGRLVLWFEFSNRALKMDHNECLKESKISKI